jgi:hypothetical protein
MGHGGGAIASEAGAQGVVARKSADDAKGIVGIGRPDLS